MAQRRPDRVSGPGHDDFWHWCNRGELRLQRCRSCHGLTWPAATACEHCGDENLDWHAMSGRGKVVSWCSFEHDYYKGLFKIPHDAILVELEEGPLFISNPIDFTFEETSFDMPVILDFMDCEDSAGHFRLPVFRKL